MASVVVTTGMGRWPFDRLVEALEPVAAHHDVWAQIGPGTIRPSYQHVRHAPYGELMERIESADVVITHAGNTVRVVQRMGKVPIVVPREAARGEMGNDHQVRFVDHESEQTPMIILRGELDDLADVIDHYDEYAAAVADRPVPLVASTGSVGDSLRPILSDRRGLNPTWDDPTRRFSWAYAQLAHLDGHHLDVGCGRGEFVEALVTHAGRRAFGVDAEWAKLADSTRNPGAVGRVVQLASRSPLPFADSTFSSVSLLDVLEHVWSEKEVLSEIHRVLKPDGVLVVTVPRLHVFSFLDPGNARFRFPGLHRRLYSLRHGSDRYHERFDQTTDGMRGDTALERTDHHNYRNDELIDTLAAAGFQTTAVDAANLFWRFADIPRSVLPDRWQHLTFPMLRADSRLFHRANLFVTARRR